MLIPKIRRLSKSKDLFTIRYDESRNLIIISDYVYEFEYYRSILSSLLKLEALMFWKMPVFES